jgi:hypothetical protein
MGRIIDLRKINIKTPDEALEFLELFVSKAPQIASVLKDQEFKRISLKNRLDHALSNQQRPATSQVVDENASVLDRMQGRHRAPVATAEQDRLAQLKAVQNNTTAPASTPENTAEDTAGDGLPPQPVAPGEIGQLNVPTVDGHAPEDATEGTAEYPKVVDGIRFEIDGTEPDSPILAVDDAMFQNLQESPAGYGKTEDEALANLRQQEAAAEAAGSKSERTPDNDLQPQTEAPEDGEGEELSDEEKAVLEVSSTVPSEEDKTPIGDKIARKTSKKKKGSKKKK